MAKGNQISTPQKNAVAELKQQVESMEARITYLETSNKSLEDKIEKLDSRLHISEHVSEQLSIDLDRLDQYHRRSNVIVRDVFLPERESVEDVAKHINKTIAKDLGLPKLVSSIDKVHRVGKIREKNGKKMQNIIVRFKNHSARYSVYNERKKAKNVKINPNLTPKRSNLLSNASNAVEQVNNVHFCFANIHGDLNFRLVEPYNGKHVFPFNSMKQLNTSLLEMSMIEEPIA